MFLSSVSSSVSTTPSRRSLWSRPSPLAVSAHLRGQHCLNFPKLSKITLRKTSIGLHKPSDSSSRALPDPNFSYRPQSEVIDFKTRIVERVQPALCEGAPVISATGVHTRGQLTGEGITTIESARGTSSTTGTGVGTGTTGTGMTGGGA